MVGDLDHFIVFSFLFSRKTHLYVCYSFVFAPLNCGDDDILQSPSGHKQTVLSPTGGHEYLLEQ